MNFRYFLYLSYFGKNYVGWQIQPNGLSVQECIGKAISTIFSIDTQVTGCGRTDAGVHAKKFVAHFDANSEIVNLDKFCYSLNSILSHDIAIQKIVKVKKDAHARFDAFSRSYEYWIIQHKNPFLMNYSYRFSRQLNISAMQEAANILSAYTDFTSFSKLHTDVKTNNCTITNANWLFQDDVLIFKISANRFLRNMVRAIAGTLLEVGTGKLGLKDFCKIIERKDRSVAGASVPAHGLYLTDVNYPFDIFL